MSKCSILVLSFLLLLSSCGRNTDEQTADAVLSANISLSKGNCQDAINVLEANGRVNNNAPYLKTLASAYACRAGFSGITFFASDIATTASPTPLGGMTKYSTSNKAVSFTLQADASFQDLQTAINILLYAGGIGSTTEPTTTERAKYFSSNDASEINSQLLYMVMAQFGRYLYFYGNSSSTGAKGSGTQGNKCLTSYQQANGTIKNALKNSGGTCTDIADYNATHAQLTGDVTKLIASTRKTRLCQGVVLLNGIIALLPAVVASALPAANQATVNNALNTANTAKTALLAADGTTAAVAITLNQTLCEDDTYVSPSNIESYFAAMVEGVFQ